MLQLSNLHGDIIATASTDTNATQPTAKFETDEFGNPRQPSTRRHGWLGGKERRTELASGVIQMGVRSYVPHMGRFTSVDPVAGGSANSYDYANADPINNLDLDGRQARWRNPWAMISPYLNKGVEKAGKAYVETVHAAWDCSKSATMNYFRTLDFRKAAFSCVVGGVRGVVRRSPWWARMKRKITEYGSRKFVCQWNNKTPRCRRAVRGDFGRSGKT